MVTTLATARVVVVMHVAESYSENFDILSS